MRRLASCLAISLLAACARAEPTLEVPTADEYAVWSAAIDSLFGARELRLVVKDQSLSGVEPPREYFVSLRADRELLALRDAYILRNRHPAQPRAGRFAADRVRLVPEFGGPMGWAARLLSDGRLFVSRVGFDRGGSRALVMVGYNCGDLCAEGSLLLLERGVDGRWRITSTLMTMHA